jgi:hypothetical protein
MQAITWLKCFLFLTMLETFCIQVLSNNPLVTIPERMSVKKIIMFRKGVTLRKHYTPKLLENLFDKLNHFYVMLFINI